MNLKKTEWLAGVIPVLAIALSLAMLAWRPMSAYPPGVGILGPSRNCLTCHVNNGPWNDPDAVIIDILDKSTARSLRQPDGTFLVTARRGELKTVVTVIGWKPQKGAPAPYRNAWLYVDPKRIADASSLNKFAPGWTVDLPLSCRVVGDVVEAYRGAHTTALPMTVRAGDDAADAELELQVMLTRGESVKGKADQGMEGNYFERRVRLEVK